MPSDVKVKLVNRLLDTEVESLHHQDSTKKHGPGCDCQLSVSEYIEEKSNVKKTSSENIISKVEKKKKKKAKSLEEK